jgi:hypothetical protein
MRRCLHFTAILVLLILVLSQRAYAYIDPGTGSYMFQMMIAFLVGALFSIKLFWKKIKSHFTDLFARRQRNKKDEG